MNSLKTYYKELILVISLTVALVLATDSLPGLYMPDAMAMLLLVLFIVALTIFLVFVWKARPKDEREASHNWYSSRFGYTLGILLLASGSVVQTLQHSVDPWLVSTLVIMVVGKVLAKLFLSERY